MPGEDLYGRSVKGTCATCSESLRKALFVGSVGDRHYVSIRKQNRTTVSQSARFECFAFFKRPCMHGITRNSVPATLKVNSLQANDEESSPGPTAFPQDPAGLTSFKTYPAGLNRKCGLTDWGVTWSDCITWENPGNTPCTSNWLPALKRVDPFFAAS